MVDTQATVIVISSPRNIQSDAIKDRAVPREKQIPLSQGAMEGLIQTDSLTPDNRKRQIKPLMEETGTATD